MSISPVIGVRAWHDAGVIDDRTLLPSGAQQGCRSTACSSSASRRPHLLPPQLPARTPKRQNVRFYATAARQQAVPRLPACRPSHPGSPEWNMRATSWPGPCGSSGTASSTARASTGWPVDSATACANSMRDHRRGGTGPLAIARAQRSQAARILLETTRSRRPRGFAAGFSSVRQCNETGGRSSPTRPEGCVPASPRRRCGTAWRRGRVRDPRCAIAPPGGARSARVGAGLPRQPCRARDRGRDGAPTGGACAFPTGMRSLPSPRRITVTTGRLHRRDLHSPTCAT